MNRRLFIAACTTTALPILSGCVTSNLMEEAKKKDYRYYTETVDRVLITEDRKALVFIGSEYHYVFTETEGIGKILDSPLHAKLVGSIQQASVSADGKTTVYVDLSLANLTVEEVSQARQFGFEQLTSGRAPRRSIKLSGTRYKPHEHIPPASSTALNQAHLVKVEETLPSGGKAALYLLSPITVGVDGVLILLTIPLLPVLVPMIATARPCCW